MTEKQTLTPSPAEKPHEDDFDVINEIQNNQAKSDREAIAEVAGDPFTAEAVRRSHNFTGTKAATAAALVGAVAGFGAGEAIDATERHLEMQPVTSSEITISQGQSVSDGIRDEVLFLAEKANIDPSAIPESLILSESYEAAAATLAISGDKFNQPGEAYKVTIEENQAGQVGLDVEPNVQPQSLPSPVTK